MPFLIFSLIVAVETAVMRVIWVIKAPSVDVTQEQKDTGSRKSITLNSGEWDLTPRESYELSSDENWIPPGACSGIAIPRLHNVCFPGSCHAY